MGSGTNLTASNVHFAGNFDYHHEDDMQYYEEDNSTASELQHLGGSHHNQQHKHTAGIHNPYGGGQRGGGRSYSHRFEDGGHHGGGFHHNHMDHHRHGGYDGRGAGGQREEINTFSLNYRHVAENNFEGLRVLLVLNLRVGERKHVRVLVYERDNIRELCNRLMSYLLQHDSFYLYEGY